MICSVSHAQMPNTQLPKKPLLNKAHIFNSLWITTFIDAANGNIFRLGAAGFT